MSVQSQLEMTFESVLTFASVFVAIVGFTIVHPLLSSGIDNPEDLGWVLLVALLVLLPFAPLFIVARNQGWVPQREEEPRTIREYPFQCLFIAPYIAMCLFLFAVIFGQPSGLLGFQGEIEWMLVFFVEVIYLVTVGYSVSRIFRRQVSGQPPDRVD